MLKLRELPSRIEPAVSVHGIRRRWREAADKLSPFTRKKFVTLVQSGVAFEAAVKDCGMTPDEAMGIQLEGPT